MAGNSYVSHKHRLVVFWSPKCACTAVVDWFCKIHGLSDIPQKRKWLVDNGYLYNYRQSLHLVNDLGYKSVQFTRDPYGRAVSAFLNKFYIYQNKPLVEMKQLEMFSREFVTSYNSHINSVKNVFLGFSFIEYLQFVEYLMTKRNVINHHWDTQLPRDVESRTRPTYIVKQESFNDDLGKVNTELCFESYVPQKKNKTDAPSGFINSIDDLANQNSLELIDQKIFVRKVNLLNNEAKILIEKIYAEDFSFFGY